MGAWLCIRKDALMSEPYLLGGWSWLHCLAGGASSSPPPAPPWEVHTTTCQPRLLLGAQAARPMALLICLQVSVQKPLRRTHGFPTPEARLLLCFQAGAAQEKMGAVLPHPVFQLQHPSSVHPVHLLCPVTLPQPSEHPCLSQAVHMHPGPWDSRAASPNAPQMRGVHLDLLWAPTAWARTTPQSLWAPPCQAIQTPTSSSSPAQPPNFVWGNKWWEIDLQGSGKLELGKS